MKKFLISSFLKRFSLALVLSMTIVFGARGQNAKTITLKMENAPLEKVMDAIENQSQYLFLNDGVDVSLRVTVNVSNSTIETALGQMFASKPVSWKIEGVNVYISKERRSCKRTHSFGCCDRCRRTSFAGCRSSRERHDKRLQH